MLTKVQYFGYGANRTPEMMEAILGRVPKGYPATLSGFELCIQSWEEMPEQVKKLLQPSWNSKFRTYFVRPVNRSTAIVKGKVWVITKQERQIIDNWELTGQWYKVYAMQFHKSEDQVTQIEIQVMDTPAATKVVNGKLYKNFLNSKEKMLRVARRNREQFLAKN